MPRYAVFAKNFPIWGRSGFDVDGKPRLQVEAPLASLKAAKKVIAKDDYAYAYAA